MQATLSPSTPQPHTLTLRADPLHHGPRVSCGEYDGAAVMAPVAASLASQGRVSVKDVGR
ncbi:hypothetical protein E2C01_032452 [Portunus trituberculatus]|uniref:Uncharacterized protein n=1 Tax=Portunus trituberculatus TaxID=210409 RepID=A0A5B7F2U9_PORTR|nr:hypothetical protein [Portunus trituberculatus]